MKLVLDASVAIKFYAPESDSSVALAWLNRDVTFVVPDIFIVEVGQALLRHYREMRLPREDLDDAIRDLIDLVEVSLGSGTLIARAVALAEALRHRLHDCMYLALAERLDHSVLTADERLIRKVREQAPYLSILSINDTTP